jgi:acetylglutamate kinase
MSLPFIKTTDELNIINIPIITDNIPVISCIGTSRDGKSTLLNIYCEYIFNKFSIKNKPTLPFLTEQSDEAITNGIDFYEIQNKNYLKVVKDITILFSFIKIENNDII